MWHDIVNYDLSLVASSPRLAKQCETKLQKLLIKTTDITHESPGNTHDEENETFDEIKLNLEQ